MLLQGLDYLHYNKVVHGDLKPDNLLMSATGKVKITDFGSSHMFQRGDTMLRTMGTPAFMAPEMCIGGGFHGRSCDIWALGICLYMFHYGELPNLIDWCICTPFVRLCVAVQSGRVHDGHVKRWAPGLRCCLRSLLFLHYSTQQAGLFPPDSPTAASMDCQV